MYVQPNKPTFIMAVTEWSYLINTFDVRTRSSFKLMYIIATDHFDKLKARSESNPELNTIYEFGLSAYKEFIALYKKAQNDQAEYGYYTDEFEQLMTELVSKRLRIWDAKVMIQYDIDTSHYKRIMRGGRMSFREGGYEMRLARVENLAKTLEDYPEFEELAKEVRDYSNRLNELRSKQQGKEGGGQENSYKLEQLRYELALVLHSMLGKLIGVYYRDPSQVKNFYEMRYLRRVSSSGDDMDAPVFSEIIRFSQTTEVNNLEGQLRLNDRFEMINMGGSRFEILLTPNAAAKSQEIIRIVLGPSESESLDIRQEGYFVSLIPQEEGEHEVLLEIYRSS